MLRLAGLEKGLVLLLAVSFALPLSLATYLKLSRNRSRAMAWYRNISLRGINTKPESVPLSRSNLVSGKFQTAYAAAYDANFAGREFCIRVFNELILRVFHESTAGLLVGPHFSLIEAAYAKEYCLQRGTQEELRSFVNDLRRMQDFCEARGIAFALVITPSKAAIYPESLPDVWRRRQRSEPRCYDNLLPLLREKGIRFVDGHRIAAEMKPGFKTPVFPSGGVHWGDPAALATTNALLSLLAQQRLPVQPIQNLHESFSDHPVGQDRDLADLSNTFLRWRYPVTSIKVEPPAEPLPVNRPNMVAIGGSFVWSMVTMLDDARTFSEVEYYSYYKLAKDCGLDGALHRIAEPTPPLDFERDVFAADSLVLEANEQTLPYPNHLHAFLQDALAVLPDPHAAKASFRYESRMQYTWGDTVSFVANAPSLVQIAATEGFSSPTEAGTYTDGSVAAVHFHASPPSRDMVLEVEAGAFLTDTRLTRQEVGVYVNDRQVGSWIFKDSKPSLRQVSIPKDAFNGENVTIVFHIARPGSPAEFGRSSDARKLGILVTRLRLHEAGK